MQAIALILIFISMALATTGCLDEPEVDLCGIIRVEDGKLFADCVPQKGGMRYGIKGRELLGFSCTSPSHTAGIKSHHRELHERLDASGVK